MKDAIILGGGLAGIAAAARLAQHGLKPVLIERRPYLGGRAFSFVDRSSGEEIDNGQHVILGSCTEFLELLKVIGTRDQLSLDRVLDLPVRFNGKVSELRANRLLGNVAALLRYKHLSFGDRMSVMRVLVGIQFSRRNRHQTTGSNSISFSDWLATRGQSDAAIERFWGLFILPVFNCDIAEVSAYEAIEFIREALLGRPINAAIGFPRCGLSTLIGEPARGYLETHGVELRTNVRCESIDASERDVIDVGLSNGDLISANTLISALAPHALSRALPDHDIRFNPIKESLDAFEYSPIVAVHLWYGEPIMTDRLMAFIDLGLQWVFNDSDLRAIPQEKGQHIVVSLSGADEWAKLNKSDILNRVQSAMQIAFPKAQNTSVINSSVVKTLDATIRLNSVGSSHRLGADTGIPGFILAGDWSDTGLPATMEGAVRSGNVAADIAIKRSRRLGTGLRA